MSKDNSWSMDLIIMDRGCNLIISRKFHSLISALEMLTATQGQTPILRALSSLRSSTNNLRSDREIVETLAYPRAQLVKKWNQPIKRNQLNKKGPTSLK